MKKLNVIILLFCNLIFSQTTIDLSNKETIHQVVFAHCFNELKPIENFKDIPAFQGMKFCNIYETMSLFYYKQDEIAIERMHQISKLFYLAGCPIILTTGKDSGYKATQENINLLDDNKIIYISIAECVVSDSENKAKDVFNKATLELIKNGN